VINAVILDWSGTLVNDLEAVRAVVNRVLRAYGASEMSHDEFRREFCLPIEKFYAKHTPKFSREQINEIYFSEFPNHQDKIDALPHAREFLEFCRGRGMKLFVCSTIDPASYKKQSERNDLAHFFDKAYIAVEDKTKVIGQILRENSLNPNETLFVGDMEHDIETARAGGVTSCAVLTGFTPREKLEGERPDMMVAHLGELRAWLENDSRG
jgi:phosphoglycolate phosphatase